MSQQNIKILALAVFLSAACSYPLDRNVGERELLTYAARVQKALPPGWSLHKDYNPYGFGTILIRTQNNAEYLRMPFGEKRFLELLIFLAVKDYPFSPAKITLKDYARKERLRIALEQRQREILKQIGAQIPPPLGFMGYLPVKIQDAEQIIEYNKLVDQQRLNQKNFPQYFTETFGVSFRYPEVYEIGGDVSPQLIKKFQEMVEKVKQVFPKYADQTL